MPEYFAVIGCMTLFCVGLYKFFNFMLLTFTNMDTEDIHYELGDISKGLQILAKPGLTCVSCYASYWGSIVYWYWMPWETESLIPWVFACVTCVFTNGLLNLVYNKLEESV